MKIGGRKRLCRKQKFKGASVAFLMELFWGCRAGNKLHHLSDSEIAHQIRDRFNFMRFLDLQFGAGGRLVPKVWLFREGFRRLNPKIFSRA
jgi:hypothetical protein